MNAWRRVQQHWRCPRRVVVQTNGIVTRLSRIIYPRQAQHGIILCTLSSFSWPLITTSAAFPRNQLPVEKRMSQSTSKSARLFLWGTLEVSAHPDTNPWFSTWSTLTLFDYFQNESPLPIYRADSSPEGAQDTNAKPKDTVRAELQELLAASIYAKLEGQQNRQATIIAKTTSEIHVYCSEGEVWS